VSPNTASTQPNSRMPCLSTCASFGFMSNLFFTAPQFIVAGFSLHIPFRPFISRRPNALRAPLGWYCQARIWFVRSLSDHFSERLLPPALKRYFSPSFTPTFPCNAWLIVPEETKHSRGHRQAHRFPIAPPDHQVRRPSCLVDYLLHLFPVRVIER